MPLTSSFWLAHCRHSNPSRQRTCPEPFISATASLSRHQPPAGRRSVVPDRCLLHRQGFLTLRSRPIVARTAAAGPILAANHVHRGTRSLRMEGIARLRSLDCVITRSEPATLAPRSGLNDLITLQNWWSGARSNRRPSAFQRCCHSLAMIRINRMSPAHRHRGWPRAYNAILAMVPPYTA